MKRPARWPRSDPGDLGAGVAFGAREGTFRCVGEATSYAVERRRSRRNLLGGGSEGGQSPPPRRHPVITIDGPAGAGKSTVSRELARRLGYRRLDTGAMYRAVALSVAAAGVAPDDEPALRAHLDGLTLETDGSRLWINGREVTGEIRTQEIGELTSRLTTLKPVRDTVTPIQRRLAAAGGVVLEGRDTGTVVCPDAEMKFYLDASLDIRARRRHAELTRGGVSMTLDAVRKEIETRDEQDMTRAIAPLRRPADAIVVDATDLTVNEVVERMLEAVERRRCCTRS